MHNLESGLSLKQEKYQQEKFLLIQELDTRKLDYLTEIAELQKLVKDTKRNFSELRVCIIFNMRHANTKKGICKKIVKSREEIEKFFAEGLQQVIENNVCEEKRGESIVMTVISSLEFPPIHQNSAHHQASEGDLENSTRKLRINDLIEEEDFDVTSLSWKEKDILLRLLYERINGQEFSCLTTIQATKNIKYNTPLQGPESFFPQIIPKSSNPEKRMKKLLSSKKKEVPPSSPDASVNSLELSVVEEPSRDIAEHNDSAAGTINN